ncbi:MAG: Sulfurtransferase [Chlamydiae bacterium]|nr:Sulfurtransferase [Chlamydiota bacterium]
MYHSDNFLDLVTDAKTRIKEINCVELQSELKKSNLLLIDVREDLEWSLGYLPHAIHISKGTLERDIEKVEPNKNRKIVLYCSGGYRSALAADNLQKMGYTQIFSLAGGSKGWTEQNFPIVEN